MQDDAPSPPQPNDPPPLSAAHAAPPDPAAAAPAAAPAPADATATAPTQDDRTFAMLTHLSSLVLGFVGPLIFWLIKREQSAFVDAHGKEALNFHITVAIVCIAATVLSCIPFVGFVMIPVFFAVGVAALVFSILAGLEANKGKPYRYPGAFRIIK